MRPQALRAALTPEWSYPEAKVVWALRAALAALAVDSLTVEPRFTTRPLLFFSATAGLAASAAFAFVPTRRPRTLKAAEAAVLAAVALHVMGHAFGLYAAFGWYDTGLHFVLPLAMVLVLYALSQATGWIWSWTSVTPVEVAIYAFCMVVTLSVLWEIVEFGMDQVFHTKEQDDLLDTMVDLIADVVGAVLGALAAGLATRYGREHGMDKVSETPKRPYPSRAPVR